MISLLLASRMESTGVTDRIQISQSTADILIGAGKEHWICPRDEIVEAKGKGTLKTYWLSPRSQKLSNKSSDLESKSGSTEHGSIDLAAQNAGRRRLIDWFVEMLLDYIDNIRVRLVEVQVNIFLLLVATISNVLRLHLILIYVCSCLYAIPKAKELYQNPLKSQMCLCQTRKHRFVSTKSRR